MNTTNHAKIQQMVRVALLSALVIVLQLFFSAVKVGPVTLNFVLVPIVIASVFINPASGLIVGALAGLTTFIQVFTSADPFYLFLMTNNPVATAFICIIKTAAAGLLAGLAYKLINKVSKYKSLNIILPAIICPVVNTGIFCLGMYIFFGNSMMVDPTYSALISGNLIYFIIVGLAGINFVIELILNVVLCPILGKALYSSKFFNK
jgi:uncharacterized membrane protein